MLASIVFITAVFGTYEKSAKLMHPQDIKADWICFTNNTKLIANGWQLDFTPYHETHPSPLDDGRMVNTYRNKSHPVHPFLAAKYYKQAFQNIPRLKDYKVVVWLDGTVEIEVPVVASFLMNKIINQSFPIVGFHHEMRQGRMGPEVSASWAEKYYGQNWLGWKQPVQDVEAQYKQYLLDGYTDSYWNHHRKKVNNTSQHFGMWVTAFVAFDNKNRSTRKFLKYWFLQTLNYTTQDQVSFSYCVQKLNTIPYTLPDAEVWGPKPHKETYFYIKWDHGTRK